MPAPQISDALLREAVTLRARYATAQEAANALGIPASTLKSRLLTAQARGIGVVPAPIMVEKPRVRVPYRVGQDQTPIKLRSNHDQISDEAIRVTVIGDLHVTPGQDLSRLKWIARHIGETQPDQIVQIGDWASFDSVSTHDPIGSVKAKYRPSLKQDAECLADSLSLFERELGPSSIPRMITLGNHEDRVRRYQDLRSELEDTIWLDVLQEFARYRWKTHDFGKVVFIGGVGFTHVPLADNGRPHSNPIVMLSNLTHDLVKGHSHRASYSPKSKIGESKGVFLIDVGTSLAHGHVEPYAKLSQTGWWWGLHDVIIRNGRIDDFARVSMKTLEARYS